MRQRTGRAGPRVLAVVAWAVATSLAGSVTWAAVTSFESGTGVASSDVLDQGDVHRQLMSGMHGQPSDGPPISRHTSSGRDGHGRHREHPPTTPPTAPPSTAQSPGRSDRRPQGGSSSSGSVDPALPDPSAGPTHRPSSLVPRPQTQSRSWSFDGGRAGVSCRGPASTAASTLVYATPEDGWAYAVVDGGPGRIEVRFNEGASRTVFTANCVDGAPVAQIQEWGDDDGGLGDDRATRED